MKNTIYAALAIAALALVVWQLQKPDEQAGLVPPVPVENASATGLASSPLTNMSDAERQAFRAEVRAYLLDSPEVLMEAIQVLESRQQEDQIANDDELVAANVDEIYEDGYSYVGGNPDGDVTLVEFVDYRCSFCRRAHDELLELLATDSNIRFIVKEFPILGEQSTISSRLAIATLHKAGPEAYHELANFLITFNGNLTEKTMHAVLTRQGLNADEILAYIDDPAISGQIASVNALAGKLQIRGTPTFVLSGEMIRGYIPLANLRDMIANVRATQE